MEIRKVYLLLIAATLLLLASCDNKAANQDVGSNEETLENLNEAGMPIVEESISLKFFAGKAPTTADNWNDIMIFNEYEEMTNIDIEWEMVPHASLEEKRNLALASGSLPDAFHSASMPAADILKYGEQGVFIPLNDLIDTYAPNIKKILEMYPEVEEALTLPDGNIYSLPQMADPEFLSMRMGPKPWINEEWLDTLGLDMPETTEDFYQYLKAVKEGDPNGNGEADEIPYGAPMIDQLVQYFYGSFGVANKGTSNGNIDMDPDEDKLRFYPITDEYKGLLEYMNKLYSEKLIAQNIFTEDHEQYYANGAEGKFGSSVWYSPVDVLGKEAGEVFTGLPALEGPEGYKEFSFLMSPVLNMGSFLITSDNENPEATLRWIDHFYGEEGMKLFFMGIEDETYEINDDGELVYLDKILNSKDGLTYEQELTKYLTFPGGGYPTMITKDYFLGAESSSKALEAADTLEPNLVKDPWPGFIYTKEENDQLAGFGADIDKYVTEMRDKFISGDASFDEWDKYVKAIEGMKLDEYMEIKEAAYERHMEN